MRPPIRKVAAALPPRRRTGQDRAKRVSATSGGIIAKRRCSGRLPQLKSVFLSRSDSAMAQPDAAIYLSLRRVGHGPTWRP